VRNIKSGFEQPRGKYKQSRSINHDAKVLWAELGLHSLLFTFRNWNRTGFYIYFEFLLTLNQGKKLY